MKMMNRTNSPEYISFWAKAETRVLEDTLRKLHKKPIHVPLGLKFRFVKDEPKEEEKPKHPSKATRLPLLTISEAEPQQHRPSRRRQRYCHT